MFAQDLEQLLVQVLVQDLLLQSLLDVTTH